MTSIAIEGQFVKNFILKDKVKRICGELASKKRGTKQFRRYLVYWIVSTLFFLVKFRMINL